MQASFDVSLRSHNSLLNSMKAYLFANSLFFAESKLLITALWQLPYSSVIWTSLVPKKHAWDLFDFCQICFKGRSVFTTNIAMF